MWKKPGNRLQLLRLSALQSRPVGWPLDAGAISVRIQIAATPAAGDLDNFITGIFDALQRADRKCPIDLAQWTGEFECVTPDIPLAYNDDRQVSSVYAERISSATVWYCVELSI